MIAPAKTKVTVPFGWVKGYPLNKGTTYPGQPNAPGVGYGFHTGVDFSYSPDRTIYAPEKGVVQVYPWNSKDYNGNYIILLNGNRRHFFGHIAQFLARSGQEVKEGQSIAIMGDTGYAEGAHLHWGLRVDGKIVDGLKYVRGGGMDNTQKAGHVRANEIFKAVLFRGLPKAEYLKYHSKSTELQIFEAARKSAEHKSLEQKLANCGKPVNATQLKPGVYQVK